MKAVSVKTTDVGAIVIFVTAVIVRGGMQTFGGPQIGDVSWVTTFAAIGASWLGISGRLADVQRNTNGKSDAERLDIATTAVALHQSRTTHPSVGGMKLGDLKPREPEDDTR